MSAQLPSNIQEEYQHTNDNILNERPQSIELSCDNNNDEEEYQAHNDHKEENNQLNQFNCNNIVNDSCIRFSINHQVIINPSSEDNHPDPIEQSNEIRELIQIINSKDKQTNYLLKQNDQLKRTVSNLVIQTKQNKAFDKINTETKLGLATYADMILALPSMKKEIEAKDLMLRELDNKIRRLIIAIENREGESRVLEEKNAKMQMTIDMITKANSKLTKEKERNTVLIKEIQNEKETINNQLHMYKDSNENNQRFTKLIQQQDSFYFLQSLTLIHKEKEKETEEKNAIIHLKEINNKLLEDNNILFTELDKEIEKNKQYDTILNDKAANEIEMQKDIDSLIKTLDEYEKEIKHLKEDISFIVKDKTKRESFSLNQIAQLQNERNYFESLLHPNNSKRIESASLLSSKDNTPVNSNQLIPMYNQAEVLHNISVTLTEANDALSQLKMNKEIDHQMIYLLLNNIVKTFDIAYSCITQLNNDLQSYRNDNKKLYDYNQSLSNHNTYLNNMLNLILDKHVGNQSIGITIRALIAKTLEIDRLIKAKMKIKAKLSTYASFIQTMNSTSTVKESHIPFGYNRNYSPNDFSEVSFFNNSLLDIEVNLNQIHSDILGLKKELDSY